jgi:hypothetical protein
MWPQTLIGHLESKNSVCNSVYAACSIKNSIARFPSTGYPVLKRPGREVDHLFESTADIKNDGAIPQLPILLHDVVLN